MTSKWKFSPTLPEQLPTIADIYNRDPEEENVDLEDFVSTWKRLFTECASDHQYTWVALDEGQKAIGHFALMPLFFLSQGVQFLAGSPSLLIVDLDRRNELIFLNFELKFIKEYRQYGYDFLYGLVSKPPMLKAHLKLGFKQIGEVPVFALPLNFTDIVQKVLKRRWLTTLASPFLKMGEFLLDQYFKLGVAGVEVVEVDTFLPEHDEFLSAASRSYTYTSLKSSSILNWRYRKSKARDYRYFVAKDQGQKGQKGKICGIMVIRAMPMREFNVIAVPEILCVPGRQDVLKAMVAKTRSVGKELRCDLVACLFNVKDPVLKNLQKMAFLKTPESFYLVVHAPKDGAFQFSSKTARPKSGPVVYDELLENWHVTWFDHDYI
jgi:hypothetical protein